MGKKIDIHSYGEVTLPHLKRILSLNEKVLEDIARKIISDVQKKRSLFVFGSGHSALLPLELFHRAGGPSFLVPLIADCFLPSAGPKMVRFMERSAGSANLLLERAQPKRGEMLWLVSQSGINPAIVELALFARSKKMRTVAFTSTAHSRTVPSRHRSGKKLYQVCDQVVDLGGVSGDAILPLSASTSIGPVSTLSGVFLAHSLLSFAMAELTKRRIPCFYTSVNTPQGERMNQKLELKASLRDPLLR